jgi:hypothetical protein
MRLDKNYYASWPDVATARFVGLDVSAAAVNYALQVGLIERGVVANLESSPLGLADARNLADVDVVLSTGAVGYVTHKTFRAILGAAHRTPWIVSFVLRMFPYNTLSALFAERGLVTERLSSALFVQRRFRDEAEFRCALDTLARQGVPTDGFESDGLLRAELYLSRPAEDARLAPIDDLVTVCSGVNRPVGTRYVQIGASRDVALEV